MTGSLSPLASCLSRQVLNCVFGILWLRRGTTALSLLSGHKQETGKKEKHDCVSVVVFLFFFLFLRLGWGIMRWPPNQEMLIFFPSPGNND